MKYRWMATMTWMEKRQQESLSRFGHARIRSKQTRTPRYVLSRPPHHLPPRLHAPRHPISPTRAHSRACLLARSRQPYSPLIYQMASHTLRRRLRPRRTLRLQIRTRAKARRLRAVFLRMSEHHQTFLQALARPSHSLPFHHPHSPPRGRHRSILFEQALVRARAPDSD